MRWLAILLAAAVALSAGRVARAQNTTEATVISSCGNAGSFPSGGYPLGTTSALTQTPLGQLCINGTIVASATTQIQAQSTLPTLSAGVQTPTGSLGGAAYVQPVFGSASGGGTQVDATHGFPVNVIAGSTSGSLADEGAFTQGTTSATPIGGIFTSAPVNLTTGQFGVARMTNDRNLMVDVEKFGGTSIVTGGVAGLPAVGGPVASGSSNADNPLKIGGPFNTTQPTVTTGQMVDAQMTARGAQIVATGVDPFSATIVGSLPAGANTIGAVTQGTSPWVNNISQWNGNSTDTNSGNATGGTLRVILATNQPNLTTPLNVTTSNGAAATAGNQLAVQVPIGGAAAPVNAEVGAGVFNTALPTLTNGQGAAFQLDASGRLIISPLNLSVAIGSTTSGQTGSLIMGAATSSAPSYSNGQTNPLSLDLAGNVRINCVTGCSASNYADESAFTQGSTNFGVVGGTYNTSITNLTAGQAGAFQSTNDRMLYVNLGKIGGTAPDTNSGNKSAGTQRVVIATDQPNLTTPLNVAGTVTANAGTNLNTSALALDTSVQNTMGCAGQTVANTSVTPINNAAASTNLKLVTKVAAKNVYICAVNISNNAAVNVALVEGTLTTNQCDTATAGLAGGATAATGWQFIANGGLTEGDGRGLLFKTATVNHDVCLLFSGATQVSGTITWAQF